jgi:RimJ/RimL family protein N-acetyltransferase
VPVNWPRAEPIETARLTLEPLRLEHAEEMAPALDDQRLHEYIGGRPETVERLRARYARQLAGHSADGAQGWLNWIMRQRASGACVGTVQATLVDGPAGRAAEVAWIVAVAHQRQGYAQEAAAGMTAWLRRHGADLLVAYVHPRHEASAIVARRLGLEPTAAVRDGEVRWSS